MHRGGATTELLHLHRISPGKPKPSGALPSSGLSLPNSGRSLIRHPRAHPGITSSHHLGTRLQEWDAPPAWALSLKSASASRAGCDAGPAPSRAQPASGWLTIFGCSPQALLPQGQSSEAPSFPSPNGQGTGMPWMSMPSELVPSSSITPRYIFPSHSQNPKLRLLSLLLPHFLSSFGSWHEPHHARWELAPAAGWRKREGRRWDHATSCSRRLLQTFLQHTQPHGTFCVTKASKNINHQN